MRFLFLIILIFVLDATTAANASAQPVSIYSFSITTPDNQQHSLSEFSGKKILLIEIPAVINTADSGFLLTMDTLANNYQDSITIIGIPSYDDGYDDDSSYSLWPFYQSLAPAPCVIAKAMSTHRTSAYQDPLFAWLTNYSQNGHYNNDVEGAGEMYFIDSQGNLYGVFGPEQPLNNALMQKMLPGRS
jgi:glutathione peroxidase